MLKHFMKLLVLAGLATALLASGAWAQERLIYSFKTDAAANYDIYTMTPDEPSTAAPLLAGLGIDAWSPRVSPTGLKLAYIDKAGGAIYAANLDGTGAVALGNTVPASCLNWSSDGLTIYFWGAAAGDQAHAFYSIPVEGGMTTPLFGGQTYWCWFYDGGFEVYGVADPATGTVQDYFLFGANQIGQAQGKTDLIQLAVSAEAAALTVVFAGLGDNYTPSRGKVDGRIIFSADHDRAGSHNIYRLGDDGSATALADLYSGSPNWDEGQLRFVYIQQAGSSYGQTAYQGTMYIRHLDGDGGLFQQNTYGTAACPSFYTPAE